MICSVYRPSRLDSNGKRVRSRMWYGQYRLQPGTPITRVPLHTTDRQVAEKQLADIIKQRERQAAGLAPTDDVKNGAMQTLADHLDGYIKDLRARGRADDYTYNVERLVLRMCAECGWKYVGDITAKRFIAWREERAKTKAPKTLNQDLDCIRGLLQWMNRQGAIDVDPLASVSKAKTLGKERRVRRAFTTDEFQRLLAVAGPRRLPYLLAGYTGLRRSELAELRWSDVLLDAKQPSISVRASTTKNARPALIPLHPDAVSALLEASKTAPARDGLVFDHIPDMTTFRKDLERANIPYRDAMGRQADFHSLRYTLATQLMNAGVHPRVVMEIMRHSDMKLTTRTYLDASQLPTAAAVNSLPGTYAQLYAQKVVPGGQVVSWVPDEDGAAHSSQTTENKGDGHDLSRDGEA